MTSPARGCGHVTHRTAFRADNRLVSQIPMHSGNHFCFVLTSPRNEPRLLMRTIINELYSDFAGLVSRKRGSTS
jgi:hypothetical protein